jgi:hypothetical protein
MSAGADSGMDRLTGCAPVLLRRSLFQRGMLRPCRAGAYEALAGKPVDVELHAVLQIAPVLRPCHSILNLEIDAERPHHKVTAL